MSYQIIPTTVYLGLWVMAAKFQFEDLKDVTAARSLLQQGLRANQTSKHIWLEVRHKKIIFVMTHYRGKNTHIIKLLHNESCFCSPIFAVF